MRQIVFAAADGTLHKLEIGAFVVLKSMMVLGVDPDNFKDGDAQAVSDISAQVAQSLIADGWFSQEEWMDAWIKGEAEDVDDELRELQEGPE